MTKSLFSALALSLTLGCAATAQDAGPPAPPGATTAAGPHVDNYRNNAAHSGYTSDKLPTPLSLLWRHTVSFIKDNPASPVYAGNTIYFAGGPNLYAVNAADGTVKWKFPPDNEAGANFVVTPCLDGGFLYAGRDDGQFYKLDAKTGRQEWARKVGGNVRSSPVVQGGTVFFGSGDSKCYALRTDTGTPIWAFATDAPITASPTLSAGQVTVASSDNNIYALNAVTGKKSWSVRLDSDPSVSPPVYSDNTIFVGSGASLFALTARGGNAKWTKRLTAEASSPPTVGNGSVFIATQDKQIYAFTTRGGSKWTAKVDYPCYAAPLLAGDVLLVPTQHGVLYALDAETGKPRWQYVVQAVATDEQPKYQYTDIASAPIFVDKTLFVLSDDGSLSAFRADAVDTLAPQMSLMTPAPGSTIPGARVFYGAVVVDEGSGVNPATVSLTVDGAAVPASRYDPSANAVLIDVNSPAYTTLPSLADGPHLATIKATDWRGNTLTQSWGFTVDNRFNPPGSSAPSAAAPPVLDTPPTIGGLPTPPGSGGAQQSRRRRRGGGAPAPSGNPGTPPPPPPF